MNLQSPATNIPPSIATVNMVDHVDGELIKNQRALIKKYNIKASKRVQKGELSLYVARVVLTIPRGGQGVVHNTVAIQRPPSRHRSARSPQCGQPLRHINQSHSLNQPSPTTWRFFSFGGFKYLNRAV
jgi:hypothetical protein